MSGKAKPQKPPTPSQNLVPVCSIGASAGGVAALQTLFRNLPTDLGLAYVVILHLSPDHPSALSEILGACTQMPVTKVEDSPTLKPNCVYVIPPDGELTIKDDHIVARPFKQPRGRRAPIDMFFRSIAIARGDGIAVILSGAGADGALGVKAVKEAGGVVMVQEPQEAGFASMPQNAISAGVVDFVAPLTRLAERIAEVARSKEAVRSLDMDGNANELRRIVAFLRARTGHDFASYKRATVMRRVIRRMQVCRMDTLAAYADYLFATPEEAQELLSDLLISVTVFFRDPHAFEALAEKTIKPLFDDVDHDHDEIRIWAVGCATGEEAYSLAILVHEEAARRKINPKVQIFASDLDEGGLVTAREGRYSRSIEADVSAERLARFFTDEGTHYRVRKELRDSVLFSKHSVIKDPPFMRLDLIACRNLLIYLERAMQQQLYAVFHYCLRPGRYLFLGSAETAESAAELFTTLDRDARLYCSRPQATQLLPVMPFGTPERLVTPAAVAPPRAENTHLSSALHAAALEQLAPPTALVDDMQNILHLSPSAGRFILHSAGPLSNTLPSVVRPELRLDLRLALVRALDQKQPTLTHSTVVTFEGVRRRVAMHVAPVPAEPHRGAQALVFFLDGGEISESDETEIAPDAGPDEVRRLHAELKLAHEALVASRNTQEATVQDLRASNEELQSINEEYRSTAEELETSKEELQSINEELHTVNAELKSKLASISVAHSDLQNLITATDIGALFLDTDLRIKMFTPPVAELFNITRADVGRAITHFRHNLDYDGLEQDAHEVVCNLSPLEREIRSRDGRWYVVRLRPYRTIEDRIDGTVVTVLDITARKAFEEVLTEEFRNSLILQELGARLITEDNIQTIYEDILTAAIDITRADAGTVQIYDPATKTLELIASLNFSRKITDYFHCVDASSRTAGGIALMTGERAFVDFPDEVDDFGCQLLTGEGIQSAVAIPLMSRTGTPLGMLNVHWRQERHRPSERELRFLDLLARQAADLIEQRRAEAALRESEERYRTMADNAPVLIWETNENGTIFVNGHYLNFFGVSAAEIEGMGWARFLHPDDAQGYLDAYSEGYRDRKSYSHECRFRRADGQYRWLRNSGGPVGARRYVGCSLDVTDNVLAAQALHEREERQTFLLKLSDALRGEADPHRIEQMALEMLVEQLSADRTYITTSDYDKGETVVSAEAQRTKLPPLTGVFRHSDWPESALRVNQGTLVITDVGNDAGLSEQNLASFEAVHIRALIGVGLRRGVSDIHWTLAVAMAEPRKWTPSEVVLVEEVAERTFAAIERARAEAALRESEERFQQFAKASSAGLWIRDAETLEMEFVSPAIADIYGVESNALLGDAKHWASMIVPEDRDAALKHLDNARKGDVTTYEFRLQRASDGAFRWIRNTDFPLRDNGHIPRIGGIAEDVTEAKLAIEHQGVLLAELQHRVRNIMAIIRSITLRTADSVRSVQEYADVLVGRLLALSRVQTLLTRAANVSVSLRSIVQDEVSVHAHHESQYKIAGPDVNISPKAAEVLTLAIHELATNALKYGALSVPEGKVNIHWEIIETSGISWLSLNWTEQGAPKRVEPKTDKLRGGFGRELIEGRIPYELNGQGRLTITDEGAVCHLKFPLKGGRSLLETAPPQRATVFGGALDMSGEADLSSRRVLVVEDDYYLATDAVRALRGAGAEVLGPCATEDQARREMAEHLPDAALLDLNLGPGPTFKLAQEFKDRNIPFVFVTGYDQEVIPPEFEDIERLEKPVPLRRIVDAVSKVLTPTAYEEPNLA